MQVLQSIGSTIYYSCSTKFSILPGYENIPDQPAPAAAGARVT
jgi:hypothetical protein